MFILKNHVFLYMYPLMFGTIPNYIFDVPFDALSIGCALDTTSGIGNKLDCDRLAPSLKVYVWLPIYSISHFSTEMNFASRSILDVDLHILMIAVDITLRRVPPDRSDF